MVISRNGQYAAITGCAKGVGVLDHVHAPVDTGPFAVPHPEYPVEARARKQVGLLATPYRCGSEILVNPRLEVNVVGLELFCCFPHGLIDSTQWTAAVSRDEAGGVKPSLTVSLSLQHREAHQCLNASHVGSVVVMGVLVVQRYLTKY